MSGKDITPMRESFALDFYWLLAAFNQFWLDFNNSYVTLTGSGSFLPNSWNGNAVLIIIG